jgi:CBS domain-containing protein
MLTDIVVARDDQPVRDVLEAMLRSGRKIVPVVDAEDRLVGVVDRADLLSALVEDA